MSTVSPSHKDKIQLGSSLAEYRNAFGTQCNEMVKAALSATYDGTLSASVVMELTGDFMPPVSVILIASSPDGNTTFCASAQLNLTAVEQLVVQTTTSTDLFNPSQQGNQVLVGVGGFVTVPFSLGPCPFWVEQTITV